MKAAFFTLGCKVNQYESQAVSELFAKKGFEIVSADNDADVYVVNSCSVTNISDQKSRKAVNHFKKLHPNSAVVLMGCFSQAFPEKAKKLCSADVVIGTKNKTQIVNLVEKAIAEKQRIFCVNEHKTPATIEKMNVSNFDERNRAFLKIQDGCNRFCSYCIIPFARGRICSKPLDQIKKEVEVLADNGFTEIVLVGIDLSSYGKEFSKTLCDAVETVADVKGIKRIRLGSLEPEIISDEDLIRLKKIDAFCPQFHLSLQSGCDETLKRMNRHYDSATYKNIVEKIRNAFHNAQITTDVMVGFAGETVEEFNKSLEFVKQIGFLKVHVFPYSVREGTKAAGFENQIENKGKQRRSKIMIQAAEQKRQEILKAQIGKKLSVLVESKLSDGLNVGYTESYIPVKISSPENVEGKIIDVTVEKVENDFCIANIFSEE